MWFRTHRTCHYTLTKSLNSKGTPASLALTVPPPHAGGGWDYLSFHSCSKCGSVRTFKDRDRDGLIPNSIKSYCTSSTFPGSHVPRGIPLIEPSLPAGQNNSIYEELNTLNPLSAMQVLPDNRVGGDDADFLCFLPQEMPLPHIP